MRAEEGQINDYQDVKTNYLQQSRKLGSTSTQKPNAVTNLELVDHARERLKGRPKLGHFVLEIGNPFAR
jgi:hypothetical protein